MYVNSVNIRKQCANTRKQCIPTVSTPENGVYQRCQHQKAKCVNSVNTRKQSATVSTTCNITAGTSENKCTPIVLTALDAHARIKKKKKKKKVHVITVISLQLVTSKHINTVDGLQLQRSVYINTDVNKLTTPRNDSLGNFACGEKTATEAARGNEP